MKIILFGKKYKLGDLERETLKVALIDAWKQLEYERSLMNDDDKRLIAQMAKIERLEALEKKLFEV